MVITVVVKAHWKKKDQSRRSKHRKWCILILPFVVTTTANNHKSPIQVTVYVFSSLNHPHYFGLVSPHPVTVYLVIDFFFVTASLHDYITPSCLHVLFFHCPAYRIRNRYTWRVGVCIELVYTCVSVSVRVISCGCFSYCMFTYHFLCVYMFMNVYMHVYYCGFTRSDHQTNLNKDNSPN